jgi:hypothetical protein
MHLTAIFRYARVLLRTRAALASAALPAALALHVSGAGAATLAANAATPGRTFVPASVHAAAGLTCKLYRAGGDPSTAITVYTNADGYARFHALPATVGSVRALTLACTDGAGRASRYAVDLTSPETFRPRPLNLENEPGTDRPALTGNPLAFSVNSLVAAGYGLRPDPYNAPAAYARWLAAATLPARLLNGRHPGAHPAKVVTTTADPWTGSTLTGKPNYVEVEGDLSVPAVTPFGDETGNVHEAIWNGLGGLSGSGLIQGGYQIDVTGGAVSYFTFREYCCGDADSNGYSGDFSPNPNDTVYSEEWYCDSKGQLNLNGGYGCTHLHDLNTGAVLDCTSAKSTSCWSVKALPLCSVSPKTPNCMTIGQSAEFVTELQGPSWVDTTPETKLTGSAYSTATNALSQTVGDDPLVQLLEDFANQSSHMNVSVSKTDDTYFNVSQFASVAGQADIAPGAQGIAVGPNANGSSIGDPWLLGINADAAGNHQVYHWVKGAWQTVSGKGTQIAEGPQGYPWLINNAGSVYYWNGSSFQSAPKTCATQIAVGYNAFGSKFGDPWTTGCHEHTNGYDIYRLEGSTWVSQPNEAVKIAVGAFGPWIVQKSGNVYYWNGVAYVEAPGNPCASDIAVAPPPLLPAPSPFGDAWILGCSEQGAGHSIYQLQGARWVLIPGSATQISVSPDHGIPWIVDKNGDISE